MKQAPPTTSAATTVQGRKLRPRTDSPKATPAMPSPASTMPTDVEALMLLGAHVLDVAGGEHDAEEADRHVDEEDPVPASRRW